MEKISSLIRKFHKKKQYILHNERGQTAVEHSLLLGVFSSMGFSVENPIIAVAIIIFIIIIFCFLLVWKPKYFIYAIILLVLIVAGSFYLRR
jgi:hypothetical protein